MQLTTGRPPGRDRSLARAAADAQPAPPAAGRTRPDAAIQGRIRGGPGGQTSTAPPTASPPLLPLAVVARSGLRVPALVVARRWSAVRRAGRVFLVRHRDRRRLGRRMWRGARGRRRRGRRGRGRRGRRRRASGPGSARESTRASGPGSARASTRASGPGSARASTRASEPGSARASGPGSTAESGVDSVARPGLASATAGSAASATARSPASASW